MYDGRILNDGIELLVNMVIRVATLRKCALVFRGESILNKAIYVSEV